MSKFDPESREKRLSPRIASELGKVDWQDMCFRLLYDTRMKYGDVLMKTGSEPKDLVQESIASVLSGDRRWNPDRGSLFTYLQWVIKSKVSHVLDKAYFMPPGGTIKTNRTVSIQSFAEMGGILVRSVSPGPTPTHLREELCSFVNENPLAVEIIKLKADDPELRPRDIAAILDTDVNEIYKTARWLKKKLRHFLSSHEPPKANRIEVKDNV